MSASWEMSPIKFLATIFVASFLARMSFRVEGDCRARVMMDEWEVAEKLDEIRRQKLIRIKREMSDFGFMFEGILAWEQIVS